MPRKTLSLHPATAAENEKGNTKKTWNMFLQTRAQNLISSQTLLRCSAIEIGQTTARKSQSNLQAGRLQARTHNQDPTVSPPN